MKKNGKLSIMLRNNNYYNTIKNTQNTPNYLEKMKYDISTTANIINEYKKISKSNLLGSELKLMKTNSLYNRNDSFNQVQDLITAGLLSYNNNFYKKDNDNNKHIIKNNNKNNNILIKENSQNSIQNNNNNIYEDDTINSSMETIKKILYSTDSKKEVVKKEKINNLLKSTKLNGLPNLKDLFRSQKLNENNRNYLGSLDKNKNKDIKEYKYLRKANIDNENMNNIIDNSFLNKINKQLTLNSKKIALKSKKILKSKTNYDFDNINNINISDEINNIIDSKDDFKFININNSNNKNNCIIKNNNNDRKFKIKKTKNNSKNIKSFDIKNNNNNQIKTENNNINNLDIDISDNNNKYNDINDISFLKEKIKELSEEINNKTLLINEYSTLAQKSKMKFEQLIIQNKKNIEKIKEESKKQSFLYKAKIANLEKEKQNILKKYLDNKKYTAALESLLFNKNNGDDNISDEDNKIKRFEEIVKKLMSDINGLKKQLEYKNKDNEKLKRIIMQFKNIKNRGISNPRTRINTLEHIKKTEDNIPKLSPNVVQKSHKIFDKNIKII